MSMRKIYFLKTTTGEKKKTKKKPHNIVFLPFSLDSVDMTRDCWKVIDGRRRGKRQLRKLYWWFGERREWGKKNATGGFGQQ